MVIYGLLSATNLGGYKDDITQSGGPLQQYVLPSQI